MNESKEVKRKFGNNTYKNVTKEILQLKANNPDLSEVQIGKLVGCSKQNVNQTFKRHGIDNSRVNDFRKFRADILTTYQDNILNSITKENYDKANLKDKVIAFSILYDKERLELGKANQIIQLSNVVQLIDKNKPIIDAEYENKEE